MEGPQLPGKQKESPESEFISGYDYDLPRRLVVCLDGTWNKRDSGTNIYNLANLVEEGRVRDEDKKDEDGKVIREGREWFQMVYYDEGVGTGVLDSITGGAFGIGLSANVREAYDWLVEKYRDRYGWRYNDPVEREANDTIDGRPDDEIYIFGFSRGAFTARSLVGLIAKCGLLRRGAPIPPAQLWEAYRILGRYKNPRTESEPSKNLWERIFGRQKRPFRVIREIVREKWENPLPPPDANPRDPVNRTEQLLRFWSRRVRVECLGVFDTVGSMGLDALAIPWLRDKIAQFHDTQPSSLTVNAFQALAIDEHRANFPHIPWRRKVGPDIAKDRTECGGEIEQRWFIGAHSNIGGGYPDNMLAEYPLAWMIKKSAKLGLKFRKPLSDAPDPTEPSYPATPFSPQYVPLMQRIKSADGMAAKPPQVRDSFTDIARGFWKGIIRSKREYREIAPPPEFLNGIEVKSVNETLDDSVLKLLRKEYDTVKEGHRYNPPNLCAYLGLHVPKKDWPVGYTAPAHHYFENIADKIWFAAWIIGIALVAAAIAHLLDGGQWYWLVPGICVVAGSLDWLESRLNHSLALNPTGVSAAFLNAFIISVIAVRLIILGAMVVAFAALVWTKWHWLIRSDLSGHVWWLLGLDVLVLYCIAISNWCALPMVEAKEDSIVRLQFQFSPSRAFHWLNEWTKDKEDRQLLMPVAHTIFRDLFAFILAYSIALGLGNWVAYKCALPYADNAPIWVGEFIHHWPSLSLKIIVCAAVADIIEDIGHLRYISTYPKSPALPLVLITFGASLIKFACLTVTALVFLGAIGWLIGDQFWRMTHGQAGGLSFVAIIATCAVVLFIPAIGNGVSALRDWWKKRRGCAL
jgi:uncharacterized protein (DUF2235 family)